MSHTRPNVTRTRAVGVVLPVHNEEVLLPSALVALRKAFDELMRWHLELQLVIILDSCSDRSVDVVRSWSKELRSGRTALKFTVISCDAHNVGYARALGCTTLLEQWSRLDLSRIWIATTDADSQVPRDWLSVHVLQHEAGVDLWAGRVKVKNWKDYTRATAMTWQRNYDVESSPIHGANLGFNALAYASVGGFAHLPTGEDRALCRALVREGVEVHFDATTRVTTSSRRSARAPLGFAYALGAIDASCSTT